ncbi:hypothetical protein KDA_74120 [Dictyobacter alpinus]|uniref:Uncharacterized protein n=1 Tax=Dictyobacter alpinus TaxID=2014873 RepID=A0A402BKN8_9CHLR|nr:hypothetical protein KDA_74120 [Dictyobacter alpinus]
MGEPFSEDFPETISTIAEEPAHMQDDLSLMSYARKFRNDTEVLTMNARCWLLTQRTDRNISRSLHMKNEVIIDHFHFSQL